MRLKKILFRMVAALSCRSYLFQISISLDRVGRAKLCLGAIGKLAEQEKLLSCICTTIVMPVK